MNSWSRPERLVAAEISAAVKAGRSISGKAIVAITGLSAKEVCDAIRRLGEAGLIKSQANRKGRQRG